MAVVDRADDSLPWGVRTLVMGVVNATPDSFSGDGVGDDADAAVRLGMAHAAAGADIVDVGGESTRPGHEPVSAAEERRRVVPVVAALARVSPVPVSVDTWKAEVADAACAAGAVMINDVWGGARDPEILDVAARRRTWVVLTHHRPSVLRDGVHYPQQPYGDVLADVLRELDHAVDRAVRAGVAWERIVIDPGLGFGKSPGDNLELLRRLGELRRLGRPILVGPSRKSFIGRVLGLPVEERDEGTAAIVALGVASGADAVRVHNVRMMARVVRMADAVVRGWRDGGGG